MKIRNLLLVVFGLSFLFSCQTDLNFTEPQPTETKNETKFKRRYRGDYQSLRDSSIITISENSIVRTWYLDTKVHKDSLETEGVGGGLFVIADLPWLKVEIEGDSAHVYGEKEEEMFTISDEQVLRHYKGYYFLNTKESDEFWTVKMLSLERGLLSFKRFLGTEAEIAKLTELTTIDTIRNAEGEVVDYSIHPSVKEFREILRSAHFGDGGSYRKIR